MRRCLVLACCLSTFVLRAGDLPREIQVKIVKILAVSVGSPGMVVCKDPAFLPYLAKAGFMEGAEAKVAYATTAEEVRSLRGTGRLIICNSIALLTDGAAVALVEEDNRPQVYFHMGHVADCKVQLSDVVLKIGKKL